MKKQSRLLKIRKKAPENEEDPQIRLIKAIIGKELAPIREQILILKQNSHAAGVMLRDIFGCALMSDSINASTKVKLEEFLTHMNASAANLENYVEIAGEELPQQVDLEAFDPNWRAVLASDTEVLRESGWNEEDLEGDSILENLSEELD